MRTQLTPGDSVTVQVPATSANLGPGFDSLGLALSWYDSTTIQVTNQGFVAEVTGEGQSSVPRDKTHLVIATVLEALDDLGAHTPGLLLTAHNTIPHGRGLGSSSAALVAGLLLGWGLARPNEPVDREWLLREAYRREGHADNVAPAVLGGFVITWGGAGVDAPDAGVRARRSRIHPDVAALALVPSFELATTTARGVLPLEVPLTDAVANASRTALLVHAMAEEPGLFHTATSDRLHQNARTSLMPSSMALVEGLRKDGYGAFISGAGPTVLVLLTSDRFDEAEESLKRLDPHGSYSVHRLTPGHGARLLTED